MAWFKVDDSIPFHPKVVAAGNLAIGLWLRAGGWCAQQMTEGFIPTGMLAPLGGTPSTARKLVGAGLWDVAEGGWRFHDWHTYQPTRAEVEGRRKRRAEAGAKGGKASGESRRESKTEANASTDGEANASGRASPSVRTRSKQNGTPSRSLTQRDISTYVESGSYVSERASFEDAPPGRVVPVDGWCHVRDLIPDEHPQVVRTGLAIQAASLLSGGTTDADVRDALTLWLRKPSLGPGVLPSLVSEAIRNRDWANKPGARRSTTDDRVAQVQALKDSPESARKALT